jgi:8-oxo-dGTP pyrophosphatase MutT (NUDIX family)
MVFKGGNLMIATPRPASTVVLTDELSRVYLTKRPKTMKFMGGFHVFPGGAVEVKDYIIKNVKIDKDELISPVVLPHYIAAARELYEEVGILLGQREDGSAFQLSKEKSLRYRRQLNQGDISFTELLEQEQLYLDLKSLTLFGQIVTPKQSKIRFDTRFFLARLPEGQEPEPDKMEIDEADWILPEEALIAFKQKQIRLAPPTIISLETVINYQKGGNLHMSVDEKDLLRIIKTYRINGIV